MIAPPATILIVDDEPQNRELLEAMLRSKGHLARTAADGDEALASVAKDPLDRAVMAFPRSAGLVILARALIVIANASIAWSRLR